MLPPTPTHSEDPSRTRSEDEALQGDRCGRNGLRAESIEPPVLHLIHESRLGRTWNAVENIADDYAALERSQEAVRIAWLMVYSVCVCNGWFVLTARELSCRPSPPLAAPLQ